MKTFFLALVSATYINRLSSCKFPSITDLELGTIPSAAPTIITSGNSSPFEACIVNIETLSDLSASFISTFSSFIIRLLMKSEMFLYSLAISISSFTFEIFSNDSSSNSFFKYS